jgi:hypothetical protein
MLNQPTFSGDLFTEVFLKDYRDLWTRFDVILRYSLLLESRVGLLTVK